MANILFEHLSNLLVNDQLRLLISKSVQKHATIFDVEYAFVVVAPTPVPVVDLLRDSVLFSCSNIPDNQIVISDIP